MITIHNIIGERPWGITITSHYVCTVLDATFTQHQQDFQNIKKYVGILPT